MSFGKQAYPIATRPPAQTTITDHLQRQGKAGQFKIYEQNIGPIWLPTHHGLIFSLIYSLIYRKCIFLKLIKTLLKVFNFVCFTKSLHIPSLTHQYDSTAAQDVRHNGFCGSVYAHKVCFLQERSDQTGGSSCGGVAL